MAAVNDSGWMPVGFGRLMGIWSSCSGGASLETFSLVVVFVLVGWGAAMGFVFVAVRWSGGGRMYGMLQEWVPKRGHEGFLVGVLFRAATVDGRDINEGGGGGGGGSSNPIPGA